MRCVCVRLCVILEYSVCDELTIGLRLYRKKVHTDICALLNVVVIILELTLVHRAAFGLWCVCAQFQINRILKLNV